jgi:ABC-type branched-subunit amino acid transport system substrate-binding protein
VFFAGYPSEATVVLRGLRKAGIKAPIIASDANATDEFATMAASGDAADARVSVMVDAPGSGGFEAAGLAAASLDAVTAWLAVKDSGAADAIAARLASETSNGDGTIRFDSRGDARLISFTAVPLIDGRWRKSARAGP